MKQSLRSIPTCIALTALGSCGSSINADIDSERILAMKRHRALFGLNESAVYEAMCFNRARADSVSGVIGRRHELIGHLLDAKFGIGTARESTASFGLPPASFDGEFCGSLLGGSANKTARLKEFQRAAAELEHSL